VIRQLIAHVAAEDRGDGARRSLTALTPRERDVADAVAEGRSNAEIGAALHMSVATVKTYVSRILAKLGCTNRVQVAILVHESRAA
jgi:DNA-binding NarL/FixJ family response regulator